MRTTWNIDDDVLAEVKEFAEVRSIPAGRAASLLMRKGLRAPVPTVWENGLLIFDPGPDTPIMTLERTLELEDELDEELY